MLKFTTFFGRVNVNFLFVLDILGDDIRNSILDGCRYVYLDVGTNVGIQIRKLFEPDLYPNASIHRVFNRYFGDLKQRTTGGICVVGFEPNPSHTSILKSNYSIKLIVVCSRDLQYWSSIHI